MHDDVARQFDEQMLAVYENGKRLLGYNATRFLQKIRKDGGVAAAKSWLRPKSGSKPTKGFLQLVEYGRLDISLEAIVLQQPWCELFTDAELDVARKRLERFGFFEPERVPEFRDEQVTEAIDGEVVEGATESVFVNRFERNAAARAACIEHYGAACRVCDMDFGAMYGSQFEGMIHVHHLVPLSSIRREYTVDPVSDLRPVCPNCHAVIHRRTPCFSIAEAKALLGASQAT